MKIAVLAWGSLVWDPQNLKNVNGWHPDGPFLSVEFARISRNDRLTLVIRPKSKKVQTFWDMMSCTDIDGAVENLRIREGPTSMDNIGVIRLHPENVKSTQPKAIIDEINKWVESKNIDAVIWTDLPENFADKDKVGKPFNAKNVIEYLNNLQEETKKKAEEYVRKTPTQIKTEIRKAIENELCWTHLDDSNKQ